MFGKGYVCLNFADHAWPVRNRYITNALNGMWDNGSRCDLADLQVASLLGCARPAAWRLVDAFGLAAGPKWIVPERHFGMHEIGLRQNF